MKAPLIAAQHKIKSLGDMDLMTLSNNAGLQIDLLPNGSICSIRHGDVLVNQVMGVPPEGAPFRLWLRGPNGSLSLMSPATVQQFHVIDEHHAVWSGSEKDWSWTVHLCLSPDVSAWSWHADVQNDGLIDREADVVIAQDLGLGSIGAVRSNESYTSHYIDHTVTHHDTWGPVLFARQNLPQTDGRHPWLASACLTGAKAFATDGLDVFGLSQRAFGKPKILSEEKLPSVRRQGEFACAALQSARHSIKPGDRTAFVFSFSFLPDHPEASSESDITNVEVSASEAATVVAQGERVARSIWDTPELLQGKPFDIARWNELYGKRAHNEVDGDTLLSFFTDDGRHVVSAEKEAAVERSHGHILNGTRGLLPDEDSIGTTVYATGIFNAQIYFGNPNVGRLLTVVRDPLQRTRGSGQRVWVCLEGRWRMLGLPSAFEMGPAHALWLYQIDDRLLELTTRVHDDGKTVSLQCHVKEGSPVRWKITHQLAFGANEMDLPGAIEFSEEKDAVIFSFDDSAEVLKRQPGKKFVMTGLPSHEIACVGSDDMIWEDGKTRGAPYAVVETCESDNFTLQISVEDNAEKESPGSARAGLPESTWQILHSSEDVSTLADILPWYRHDAWIHLAAPHGLEQYGGAAWGVRDVCQGPVEWLLTEQRYDEIRSILKTVFAHQYEDTGLWPQWFMLGRYADIQQKHCHGDIMFWPLKALCDYAAASNDVSILDVEVPFTDGGTFEKTNRATPLSVHVERVIDNYRKLCIPGTALVAYGDGDWDDTLQPARPEMREGMVSTWTVELAYQVFNQLVDLYRRSGRDQAAEDLNELTTQIRRDFNRHLMPDGIVAGFATFTDGEAKPMLHPRDESSGIQYRLLPMIRGVISGLFDPGQASVHMDIINKHLRFPDGVHLMNHPVTYRGGISRQFQRAETAAHFGREVSLQYVHAHIRYTEAMARLGHGDEVWWGLQTVNPLGLRERLPSAALRQANVYFSSSDADVLDRHEAAEKFDDIRHGRIPVKAGWRLYSSGPGLFLHKVYACLFGVREHYGDIIFDPVLPGHLSSGCMQMKHEGRDVTLRYSEGRENTVTINGVPQDILELTGNPYRRSGIRIDRKLYSSLLQNGNNDVDITVRSPR